LPVHKSFYFLPKKLRMDFLLPVNPAGLTSEALKEKVFEIMKEHYVRHNN